MNNATRPMLRSWPKWAKVALALMLTGLLGVVDYLTGTELVVSTFYLVPICWACRAAGRTAGLVVSVACAIAWLVSDLLGGRHYTYMLVPYWNALMLLVLFAVVVLFQSAFQSSHRRLEETVVRRTAALQAEIVRREAAETARLEALQRLADAQETERAHISRELHDQFGQDLTALKLALQRFRKESQDSPPARHSLIQMEELAGNLIRGSQRLAWELHPSALDDFGLEAALQRYTSQWAEQTGVPVDYRSAGLETRRLPREFETALYRIAQEALTNVARHAQAKRASVLLEEKPGHVSLIVEDDGRGFDAEAMLNSVGARRNLGLRGIRERAMLAGGTVEFESTPGVGTTVLVRLPLESEAKNAAT
jgi:signal transduction histidine kinase